MYNRVLRPGIQRAVDMTSGGNMAPGGYIEEVMNGGNMPYTPPPIPYDSTSGPVPAPAAPPTTSPVQGPDSTGGIRGAVGTLRDVLMRRQMARPSNGPYTTNVTNRYAQFFGRRPGTNPNKPMNNGAPGAMLNKAL